MFELNKTYNFTTYSPNILGGAIFKNMKVTGIIDLETALSYSDVVSIHNNIYNDLPPGTTSNESLLTFIKFRDSDGKELVLAQEWIDGSTVMETQSTIITITINDAGTGDVPDIKDALRLLGFSNFSVKTT